MSDILCHRKKSVRDVVHYFDPAWFTVAMGAGAISILFLNYPYGNNTQPMKVFTFLFFFLDLALFILFTAMGAARLVLFPEIWSQMLRHPTQSLYLATFPISATTLINVAICDVFEVYGFGGKRFVYAIWGFWWLDAALSFISCFGLVHVIITRQEHSLRTMTCAWLLPFIPMIISSSTGVVIAQALQQYSKRHALLTVAFAISMVTTGSLLSIMMFTIYVLRLILFGYPTGLGIISSFLPLSAFGQAAYAIVLIGQSLQSLLPLTAGSSGLLRWQYIGDTFHVICVTFAVMLWCFATTWIVYAILGIQEIVRHKSDDISFKLSFWSMIFPNGVYANLTIQLYRTLDSPFFRVWGAIYAATTLVLWVCVAVPTIRLIPGGTIFETPYLDVPELPTRTETVEVTV